MTNEEINPKAIETTNRIAANNDSEKELSRQNHILNVTKDKTVLGIVHVLNNKCQKVTTSLFVNNPQPVEPNIPNTLPMNINSEETAMAVHHHSTGTQHTHITSETTNIPSKAATTYKTISSLEPKPLATHTHNSLSHNGSGNIMSSAESPDSTWEYNKCTNKMILGEISSANVAEIAKNGANDIMYSANTLDSTRGFVQINGSRAKYP